MFFDKDGATGFIMTRKRLICLMICAIGFVGICLLPLDPYMTKTLAVLFFFIFALAADCFPTIVATTLLAILTIGLNLVPVGEFLTSFGSSPFVMVMALLIFSEGARSTRFSARISYWLIYKLGTSPARLNMAIFVSTFLLSMFIADIPATLLMWAIAKGILDQAGEEPGGKLGKAFSLSATWGSILGGATLISGSGINVTGINMLEKITEGSFTISYAQWAMLGIPFGLLMILPSSFIMTKVYKLSDYKIKEISKEYIKKSLDALGPIDAGEKRFLMILCITLLLFLTSSQTKFALPFIALISMCLSIFPGIGTVNFKKASKTLPWDTLFLLGVTVAFASSITKSGLGDLAVRYGLGWAVHYPLWVITMVVVGMGLLLHLIFAGNPNGVVAVYVAAIIPLATEVFGIHPGLLLLPAMISGSCSIVQPIGTSYFMVDGFGFSKLKDRILPCALIAIPWIIILTICSLIILPMFGWT